MINNQWYAVASSKDFKKGRLYPVERQDKRVVEKQIPSKTALRIDERLLMADKPIIEYRRRREELQRS